MDAPRFLSGQFLLAMPGIGDPRFEKAVIAMCVHDEEGRARHRPRPGGAAPGLPRPPQAARHPARRSAQRADPSGRAGRAAARLHPPLGRLERRRERPCRRALGALRHDRHPAGRSRKGRGRAAGSPLWAMPAGARTSSSRSSRGTAGSPRRATNRCSTNATSRARWAAAFKAAGIDSRLLTSEYGTA